MNFDEAITAHVTWKIRLLGYVGGLPTAEKLDSLEVARDDACALGKWLHGEGQRFAALPKFSKVVDEHARFHRCAAEVIQACDRGDRKGAEALVAWNSQYAATSNELVGLIGDLRAAVEKHR